MADEQWDMLSLEHGTVAVVARYDRIVRICFESSSDDIYSSIKKYCPEAKQFSQALTMEGLKQLTEYFYGKRRVFDLPLGNDSLTAFSCKVHQALLKVPYGSVISYSELAAKVGSPKAARAVGRVMSSNPLPLFVPCHRVVNADGRIGHYSAAHGSKTKAWLIEFESRVAAQG